jgi:hypothetical protein
MKQPDLGRLRGEQRYLEARLAQELGRPDPNPFVVRDLRLRRWRVRAEMSLTQGLHTT